MVRPHFMASRAAMKKVLSPSSDRKMREKAAKKPDLASALRGGARREHRVTSQGARQGPRRPSIRSVGQSFAVLACAHEVRWD